MPSIVLKSHIFTAVCNLFLSAAHKADVRARGRRHCFFIANTPTKDNIDICMRNLFYVIALFFVSISLQAAQLNVASFNIWMSPDGIKNGWQDRKESVARAIGEMTCQAGKRELREMRADIDRLRGKRRALNAHSNVTSKKQEVT